MTQPLITHVLWRLDRAGAERTVFELARRLPAHGFRVRVVAAGGGGVMARDFYTAGIPLAIGPSVGPRERRQTVHFLRRELRAHWPSVWHTHLGADVWGGFVAHQEGMRPWVSTVHDVQPLTWIKGWMRGKALRSADHVICVSETVRGFVREHYGREDEMSVVRLGVDLTGRVDGVLGHTQAMLSMRDGWQEGRRLQRFVVVGRLVAEKRVDTLIAALAGIREPWHLVIVGEGPERFRLEQMVDHLRLRARVQFVGSVSDVRPYLQAAEACLFASRSEGQGLAVLEAAVVGVPLLVTDLPAVRELFDEHSMAFVAAEGDARAWMQAIQRFMYDSQTAYARAQCAQAIVQEHCSMDRMVEDHVELYHRLMRSGGRGK